MGTKSYDYPHRHHFIIALTDLNGDGDGRYLCPCGEIKLDEIENTTLKDYSNGTKEVVSASRNV